MEIGSIIQKIKSSFIDNFNSFLEQVPNIVGAIVIIVLGFLIANFLTDLFRRTVSKKVSDPLMTNFLSRTVKLAMAVLVILFALKTLGLGTIANALLTGAGASAIIIGFAFRDIGENFISGVILAFNRPFKINDTIQIGDIFGKVKNMEFRYTKLKTFDGRDVYIPNSDVIKKAVFNYTEDGYFRLEFVVGVAYEEVIEDVEQVILHAVSGVPGVIEDKEHETFVVADELATSTVNLKVYFWVETLEYRKQAAKIRSDVVSKVKDAIVKNGMSMPADIQEIKLYGSQSSIPIVIKQENE
ncbi:MAG: mechanosensitive ion channel [Saprospiraceae bacterium]|nr:mechanosensitive ion channel [Saprospiraceae bacterium]